LTTGEQLQYDVVVIAVGVRPNTALLKDAGGKVGRGITVNEKGETSLPDIYAAGDCVELYDISTKAVRPLAILPNAYLLGEVCGKNMAGSDEALTDALPVNAIGFFGLHMVTAGSYTGESRVVKTENGFRKFFIENDQLKGFIIVGDVSRSGIYTDLIRRQVKLSELDFDLLAEYPSLAAFKREYRDQILGGQKA
jgi:NAD(P)H-nitrite reductase large subunit